MLYEHFLSLVDEECLQISDNETRFVSFFFRFFNNLKPEFADDQVKVWVRIPAELAGEQVERAAGPSSAAPVTILDSLTSIRVGHWLYTARPKSNG